MVQQLNTRLQLSEVKTLFNLFSTFREQFGEIFTSEWRSVFRLQRAYCRGLIGNEIVNCVSFQSFTIRLKSFFI